MMRMLGGLAALCVVAATAVALAPATLLANRVAALAQGQLALLDARGTLWRGRGALATSEHRASLPIAWRIAPVPLVSGTLDMHLVPADGAPPIRGDVQVQRDRLVARDLEATLPASIVRLPGGALAGGEIRVTSDMLVASAGRQEGQVHFEWRNARIAVPGLPVLDLGTATAALTADGPRWRGPVHAQGGALAIDGELILEAAGAELALTIVPQPGTPDALRQWLGPTDGNGAVRWRAAPRFR